MNNDSDLHFVRLTDYSPAPVALKLLPEAVARRNVVVPLCLEGDHLVVATSNPADERGLRAVAAAARRPVLPLLASYPEIRAALARIYGSEPASPPAPNLGRLLRQLGHLSEKDLEQTLASQAETRESLSLICLRSGLVDELDLAEALAWHHYLPHIRLDAVKLQSGLTALIPWELARDGGAIPLWWLGDTLVIGTAAPEKQDGLEAIANRLDLPVRPVVCPATQWTHTFRGLYLRGQRRGDQGGSSVIDILLRRGILSELNLIGARAVSRKTGQPLKEIILKQGLVTRVYSDLWGSSI